MTGAKKKFWEPHFDYPWCLHYHTDPSATPSRAHEPSREKTLEKCTHRSRNVTRTAVNCAYLLQAFPAPIDTSKRSSWRDGSPSIWTMFDINAKMMRKSGVTGIVSLPMKFFLFFFCDLLRNRLEKYYLRL